MLDNSNKYTKENLNYPLFFYELFGCGHRNPNELRPEGHCGQVQGCEEACRPEG